MQSSKIFTLRHFIDIVDFAAFMERKVTSTSGKEIVTGTKRNNYSFLLRCVDRVFGYDFFISYSHADGLHFPKKLKAELEHQGFRVFLDQTDYVAGVDLRRETRRQVVKSKQFVLIARENALKSEWVRREVEIALATKKTPVLIDVNNSVSNANEKSPIAVMAREQHWLRLPESLRDTDGDPSSHAVSELIRGFKHTRQETKRVRIFAIAASVLAIISSVAIWQAHSALQQRDLAQRNFTAAKQAADGLIFDLVQGLRNVEGLRSNSIKLILDRADQTLEDLQSATENDTEIQRSRAVMHNEFAKLYLRVGDTSLARENSQNSGKIAERLLLSGPPSAQRLGDVAAAFMTRGDVARSDKELDQARNNYEVALSRYEEAMTLEPDDLPWQRNVSAALNRLAQVSYWKGEISRSRKEFGKSLEISQILAAHKAAIPRDRRGLAASLNNVANVSQAEGDYYSAVDYLERAATLIRTMIRQDDTNTLLQEYLLTTLNNLGDARQSLGQTSAAREAYKESLQASRALFAKDPQAGRWERQVSTALNKMGDIAKEELALNEAKSAYLQSLEIRKRLAASDDKNNRWQRDLAVVLSKLGEVAVLEGNESAARQHYEESLQIRETLARKDPKNTEWKTDVAWQHMRLGDLAETSGRFEEALEYFRHGHDKFIGVSAQAPNNLEALRLVTVALNRIGKAHLGNSNIPSSISNFENALKIRRKLAEQRPRNLSWLRDLSVVLLNLGEAHLRNQNKAEATKLISEGLEIRRNTSEQIKHPTAQQMADLAEGLWKSALLAGGRVRRERLSEALQIMEKLENANTISKPQTQWLPAIRRLLKDSK